MFRTFLHRVSWKGQIKVQGSTHICSTAPPNLFGQRLRPRVYQQWVRQKRLRQRWASSVIICGVGQDEQNSDQQSSRAQLPATPFLIGAELSQETRTKRCWKANCPDSYVTDSIVCLLPCSVFLQFDVYVVQLFFIMLSFNGIQWWH
jgi:hypothetical protein